MKAQDLDKAICDWSISTGESLTDRQQATLMASIFNTFWSDGHIHTMPDDGTHLCTKQCWCEPVLNYKDDITNKEVWLHTDTRKGALN